MPSQRNSDQRLDNFNMIRAPSAENLAMNQGQTDFANGLPNMTDSLKPPFVSQQATPY